MRDEPKTTPSQFDPVTARRWWERWPVEAEVLIALGLAAAGVLAFLLIGGTVLRGGFRELDEALLLALRNPADLTDPLGPAWFEELVRDMTALGSTGVLTLIVLAVAGYLYLSGSRGRAIAVILWSVAGTVLSHVSKLGFARPRPELVPHGAEVFTLSFPSGHAMLSAVIYLTLGAMLAATQAERRIKSYILGFAVLLTLLVGTSRVYLGVHWPSDVLAGWALGAAWATLGWLVFRRIGVRRPALVSDPRSERGP
jgi:undecaprenyl-diphosphatase